MNLKLVKVLEINTVNKHSPCLQLGNSQSQWTPRKEVFIHYLVKILEEPKMFASWVIIIMIVNIYQALTIPKTSLWTLSSRCQLRGVETITILMLQGGNWGLGSHFFFKKK